jgi:hypothetical protein
VLGRNYRPVGGHGASKWPSRRLICSGPGIMHRRLTSLRDTPRSCQSRQASPVNLRCISTPPQPRCRFSRLMSYSHRSCHMSFIFDSAVRFDGPDRGVSRSPILPHGSSATSARSLPASRSTSPVAAPPTDEALQGNTLHGLPDCLRSAVPSYQKLVAARRSQDCGGQLSNSTGVFVGAPSGVNVAAKPRQRPPLWWA